MPSPVSPIAITYTVSRSVSKQASAPTPTLTYPHSQPVSFTHTEKKEGTYHT
ncbi:hypothetical protein BDB00DRAFT_859628 [Zychaea mexicana]|uniref:uncharacterized protein n=1 Tax=Zychaea mexicana TaxID=64656 RepID=UPI0022FDED36|nr:uncharacterized protein BDB00DRAFT_859628 [Zychaea mexicana]KAI9477096.1 hypothetical protein BDB00DRAFT_859628 [Zychaea mexicana]